MKKSLTYKDPRDSGIQVFLSPPSSGKITPLCISRTIKHMRSKMFQLFTTSPIPVGTLPSLLSIKHSIIYAPFQFEIMCNL